MFRFLKTADGASGRPLARVAVGTSKKVNIGGLVKLAAGGVENISAVTDRVYGICQGFVTADGAPIDYALESAVNGTYAKGVSFTQAGNQNKPVMAIIHPVLPNDILRADVDDDLGDTTGSDKIGAKLDGTLGDTRFLDESTVADASQFQIVGIKGKRKADVMLLSTGLVTGVKGDTGAAGEDGADGTDGVGVPAGGTTGQILAKSSDTDYATGWVTPAE